MLWLQVLDRALEWPGSGGLSAAEAARTMKHAWLLRRVVAAHMLGFELDREDRSEMLQWLQAVTLHSEGPSKEGLEDPANVLEWPAVRGKRHEAPLPQPYESLLSTALVQFLSQWGGQTATAIHRCHGILRGPRENDGVPEAWESEFARRAGIREFLRRGELHQCGHFVWADRGSRYCCKACSNASFAIRKLRDQPRYFAEKQERYRARLDGRKSRRSGAFVYIDSD